MDDKFYPLKNYESFYEINKKGVVRSLDRLVNSSYNAKRIIKGKIIKPELSNMGYLRIPLSIKGVIRSKIGLHRLIAINFIQNPNNFKIINHKDNNPLNNDLNNLEWCTQSHNMHHKFNTGYIHHRRKLNENAVIDIYKNAIIANNYKTSKKGNKSNVSLLCKKYNITKTVVYGIIYNKTYTNITKNIQ